jgi:putative membrane fusion protein
MQVESKIKLLESIASREFSVDAAECNREIYSALRDISGLGARGRIHLNLNEARLSLERSVLSMNYVLGEYGGIRGDIERLKSEKNALDDSITETPEYLKAGRAGYSSHVSDGREELLRFDELTKMTPEAFKAVMYSGPEKLPDNVLGKMIYGYDWYAAALIKSKEAAQLAKGGKYVLETAGESFNVRIEAINISGDGAEALVVMKCNVAPKNMAASRVQACRIILNTYEGFKIPHEALRVVDGQAGVFVIEGVKAVFKPVEILYKGTSFYLVAASSIDRNKLFLYDEVILNRDDLYDGKVVG